MGRVASRAECRPWPKSCRGLLMAGGRTDGVIRRRAGHRSAPKGNWSQEPGHRRQTDRQANWDRVGSRGQARLGQAWLQGWRLGGRGEGEDERVRTCTCAHSSCSSHGIRCGSRAVLPSAWPLGTTEPASLGAGTSPESQQSSGAEGGDMPSGSGTWAGPTNSLGAAPQRVAAH